MKTRIYRKQSLSKKLKVIDLYQSGLGSSTISKNLKISTSYVKELIQKFNSYGIEGLQQQKQSSLSHDIKIQVVKDVLEKSLSYPEVALKYKISKFAAYSWTQQVRIDGYESLNNIKKGRPRNYMGKPKKKQVETDQEKLQKEVHYLRAENAYLKKLKALVQERIDRENGKKSESSKN